MCFVSSYSYVLDIRNQQSVFQSQPLIIKLVEKLVKWQGHTLSQKNISLQCDIIKVPWLNNSLLEL
jgi:hypothetical protein